MTPFAHFPLTPPRGIVPTMPDTPQSPLILFLAERDVPCPNPRCNFNLRGLTSTTCPECKEPLGLSLRRAEALWYMRKFVVTATSALMVSAGLVAWACADYWNLERWGFVGRPSPFVLACVEASISLGLAISLVRCLVDSRRKDARALPRLLCSFAMATIMQAAAFAAVVGFMVFG